jgi:hypothetical protein
MSETQLKPHRGVLILVLGILSIVVCPFVLGQVAWVLGNQDLREIDAGRMDPEGRGLTMAGKVLGIVATVYMALCLIFGFIMLVGLIVAEAN